MAIVTMFKIKSLLVLSIAILFVPTKAMAAWVQVGEGDDIKVYIETASINHKGKEVFFALDTLRAFPDDNGAIASTHYQSVDCSTGVNYSQRLIGFNKSGRVVYDEVGGTPAPPARVGSIGRRIYDFVCRQ
jgi:hypothetical protein